MPLASDTFCTLHGNDTDPVRIKFGTAYGDADIRTCRLACARISCTPVRTDRKSGCLIEADPLRPHSRIRLRPPVHAANTRESEVACTRSSNETASDYAQRGCRSRSGCVPNDVHQTAGVRHSTRIRKHLGVRIMKILVNMINPAGV